MFLATLNQKSGRSKEVTYIFNHNRMVWERPTSMLVLNLVQRQLEAGSMTLNYKLQPVSIFLLLCGSVAANISVLDITLIFVTNSPKHWPVSDGHWFIWQCLKQWCPWRRYVRLLCRKWPEAEVHKRAFNLVTFSEVESVFVENDSAVNAPPSPKKQVIFQVFLPLPWDFTHPEHT